MTVLKIDSDLLPRASVGTYQEFDLHKILPTFRLTKKFNELLSDFL